MRLPSDWDTESASGWWSLHHLIHTPCSYRTNLAYDLVLESNNIGSVREVVYSHECDS